MICAYTCIDLEISFNVRSILRLLNTCFHNLLNDISCLVINYSGLMLTNESCYLNIDNVLFKSLVAVEFF